MSRTHGFTLIELSIVLVIIALIVAGILVGREMIEVATARSQLSEWDKLRANAGAFQNKYNCLPGDCPNATNFFTSVQNGDGNKLIQSAAIHAFWQVEPIYMFRHLHRAGLTEYTGVVGGLFANTQADVGRGIPALKVNKGSTWFVSANHVVESAYYCPIIQPTDGPYIQQNVNYIFTGVWEAAVNQTRSSHATTGESTLGSAPAFYIDSKIDDGIPTSGGVLAIRTFDALCNFQQIDRATSDLCVATSGQYNLSNDSTTLCSLAVKAGF